MTLHLTKVAVGCRTVAALIKRQAVRVESHAGQPVVICWTRYMPTRHAELRGGSLVWIIKQTLAARQIIVDFDMQPTPRGERCRIILAPEVMPLVAAPMRGHQGWRYLAADALPPDLSGAEEALTAMPLNMMRDLGRLGLL